MDGYLPYVSLLVALIGIAVTIYLGFRFNSWAKRKELSYEVVTEGSIFSVDEGFRDRVKVTLDDELVTNLSFVVIQIQNSGKVSITKADFDEPLTLSFSPEARIISTEIVDKNPSVLKVAPSVLDNRIVISPLLLNAGDTFVIKVVLDGESSGFSIEGRIDGVKEFLVRSAIERLSQQHFLENLLSLSTKIIVWVALVYFVLFYGRPYLEILLKQILDRK